MPDHTHIAKILANQTQIMNQQSRIIDAIQELLMAQYTVKQAIEKLREPQEGK